MPQNLFAQHQNLFICPQSGQNLRYLEGTALLKWNDLISRGEISDARGTVITEPLVCALATDDERTLYPIHANILHILPQSAYQLGCEVKSQKRQPTAKISQSVQTFYDEVMQDPDWQAEWIDARDFVQPYCEQSEARLKQLLPEKGEICCDIGAGSQPFSHGVDHFKTHLCMDISLKALQKAQSKQQEHELYILCDMVKLPLKTNTLDMLICRHSLNHVPAQEQLRVVAQFHRVLKPSKKALIVYRWGNDKSRHEEKGKRAFFHGFKYKWFEKTLCKRFQMDLQCWRFIGAGFLRTGIQSWLAGGILLRILSMIENTFPSMAGRFGAYPLFVMQKSASVYKEPHSV